MKKRRRGAELEKALLEAAWTELEANGYPGLTMEDVAARAGTSRPVLARRWNNKAELAIASIRHQMGKIPMKVTDHGDLRKELLQYLNLLSKRTYLIAPILTLFSSFPSNENLPRTLKDLRTALVAGSAGVLEPILDRAAERGEIDKHKLNPTIIALLRDLCRSYAILNFAPPPLELRELWVDSIFLPLVQPDKDKKC